VGISSLIDTWLLLRNLEQGGEHTRALYVLKARGMAHSSRVREFRFTDRGVDLVEVYVGPSGILTGSARDIQEMRDQAALSVWHQETAHRALLIERKRRVMEARIAELQAEFETERREVEMATEAADAEAKVLLAGRREIADPQEKTAATRKAPKGGRK
jgi:circadian clock protein KaiC